MSIKADLEVWERGGWGFSRYMVSDQGRVRGQHDRVLKPQTDRGGYIAFHLYRDDGTVRNARIGRLVLETFVGPMPEGQEVRHLNDVKTDNRLENLAYGTREENLQDAIKNGKNYWHKQTKCRNGHDYPEDSVPGLRRCQECADNYNVIRNARRRKQR